eukprot:7509670-Alexandrium_andersonii.AAC.1
MVNSARAGHPVCPRSWRAWMTAQASATCSRPSDAGGNAPRAARPSFGRPGGRRSAGRPAECH